MLLPLTVTSRLLRPQTVEATCVIAGFVVLTLFMTYPLVHHLTDSLPGDLGDPLLNAWILAWDSERLLHGLQGFWDAPFFYPYARTLTYSEHLLGIAILVAPIQWLSDNLVLTYNIAFILSYVLAGIGMYLLAKWLTGNRLAAAVAGVTFAFCPFRLSHVSHLQILFYGWMPIGLWALHQYFASGSRKALLGFLVVFIALACSSGYYLYFFCLPVGVLVIYQLVRRRHEWKRLTAELSVCAILFGVAILPIASAYYQTRRDQGLVRSRGSNVEYAADVVSYLQIPQPLWAWGNVLESGPPELALFPGSTVLVLAFVAIVACGRRESPYGPARDLGARRVVGVYLVIGVAAFCLSLGPEPSWSGRVLLTSGPYDWLLRIVPGLDGLRVPARMAAVVYLCLAVLAACGTSALLARLGRRFGAVLTLAIVSAVLVEGHPGTLPYARFVPEDDVDASAAYDWLRDAPPGPAIELPVVDRDRLEVTLGYMVGTLRHHHPIVNGYSGYDSRLNSYLAGTASPLSDLDYFGEALRALRSLGVKYVVVHETAYLDADFAQSTLDAFQRHANQVRATREFGAMTIVEFEAWNEPEQRDSTDVQAIPADYFRATASRETDRLSMAFDGDPATRWLTGGRQVGDEWVQIQFDSHRNVARVRLGMARRSFGDYPRILTIESSDDGETFRRLYHASPLPEFVNGIVRHTENPPIDIALPPNRTLTLRLRQRGQTRSFYWSIHELQFWEQ